MAAGATGFKIASGGDLNGVFWYWQGDVGNRNVTDANGNCAWACACNACNSACNCNCGNCDAADISLNVIVTDYRINLFVSGAYNGAGIRHDSQDQSMGHYRYYRTNCNCNCACNCNC